MKLSDQAEFTKLYNAVGNPGTVFGTTIDRADSSAFSKEKNVLIGEYNREHPTLLSYVLQVFINKKSCNAGEEVTINLMLTSKVTLPFEIDLSSDLSMSMNGVYWKYSYVKNWSNNTATIKFLAPDVVGEYKITFDTAFEVQTSSAKAHLKVISSAVNDFILASSKVVYAGNQDVTVIHVVAQSKGTGLPVLTFGKNSTLKTQTISNVSPVITDGKQTMSLPSPVPPASVLKPWFSFHLEALCSNNFAGISADLAFTDTLGVTQWVMPIALPTNSPTISITFPFPDWNDSYTFMLGLIQDVGWKTGTFSLIWTHPTDSNPVTVTQFSVSAADASNQPIAFTNLYTNDPAVTLFPIVWVNGSTDLVFWADEDM